MLFLFEFQFHMISEFICSEFTTFWNKYKNIENFYISAIFGKREKIRASEGVFPRSPPSIPGEQTQESSLFGSSLRISKSSGFFPLIKRPQTPFSSVLGERGSRRWNWSKYSAGVKFCGEGVGKVAIVVLIFFLILALRWTPRDEWHQTFQI